MILLCLAAGAAAQTREQAVAAARDGRLDEGIAGLRSLIAAGDTSANTAYDLAVVLTWAKRPQEATDVFERTNSSNAPEYVLLAMTRAYWDQRRFPQAEDLARRGMTAFPANRDWTKLFALISGDAAERAGDPYSALHGYLDALRKTPEDADIKSATAGVLARLGAPYIASVILGGPDTGLEARKASLMVRWGANLRPTDPALRYVGTDAALARLDELIAQASTAQPQDAGLLTRLRRDRVVALRDRNRWADAITQVEELRRSGDRLPTYVRQAEADCLLTLRRPADARRAYEEVIEAEPQNQSARVGLFFAEVETEDWDAAFANIDSLATMQKPVTGRGVAAQPNPAWLNDQISAALARSYAGMQGEAWERLDYLAAQAPGLAYLRGELGKVAASRGWPRRAAEEVEIAASLAPVDLGGQVALADSSLWMKQYAEARKRADGLALEYPDDPAVQRLIREVGMVDKWEFTSDSHSYNEGAGILTPNSPGSGYDSTNRIYSPLLGYQWRVMGGFNYEDAHLPEGFVQRYRVGGGIEWRRPFLTVELAGWDNLGLFHRGGADLDVQWIPTDHWNFAFTTALFTWDTPTRALFYGITANKFGFNAGHDWNESTGFAANFRYLEFSSGNRRLTGGYRFVQKLLNRPHLNITLAPEVYYANNSKTNEPYWNPRAGFAFHPAVDIDHTIWRRYEHSIHQHVHIGAGGFWERGYGTDLNLTDSYELIFNLNPVTNLRAGGTFTRRAYDGEIVNALSFALSLTRRF